MTATISSKPQSFFFSRFKNDISGNKKQLIVNIVLQCLGLPVLAVIMLIFMYFDGIEYSEANAVLEEAVMNACVPFTIMAVVTICVSLLMGMVIPLFHFSYLYKKTIADMNYSLPLNGTQRFFADYLSGITLYMAPAIGAVLLSIAILGIGTAFVPSMTEFWESFSIVLKFIFIVLIAMAQFYTLSVLAISFCGNTFESIFSILAFNVMIPATVACVWLALCKSSGYGIDGSAIMMKNIFTSTSPIGSVFFFFNFGLEATELNYSNSNFYTSLYLKWIVITLIFTAIYLAAAYLLCRFRKAEDVSKPYVYRSCFYCIMTMAVFCILSLFISLGAFVGAGIVICAVGWFIMEVITRRGFKKFWQAGIGFAASVISVLLACQLCIVTDGFGMSKNVPSSLTVESVDIRLENLTNYNYIKFNDKAVIKEAIALHQEAVDRHFNSDDYTYEPLPESDLNYALNYDSVINLKYSTYAGTSIMREYEVPSSMTADLTKAILLSAEYARFASVNIMRPWEDSIEIRNKVFNSHNSIINSEQNIKAIEEAYYADLKNMTEDDLLNPDVVCYISDNWVLSSFENTIALLESFNISFDEINSQDIGQGTVEIIKYPEFTTAAERIFEKDDDEDIFGYDYYNYNEIEFSKAESITITHHHNIGLNSEQTYNVTDQIIDLINRSTPIVLGEKPIAVITVNHETLYLLDRGDNKKLLNQLYTNITVPFNIGNADDFSPSYSDENIDTEVVDDWE